MTVPPPSLQPPKSYLRLIYASALHRHKASAMAYRSNSTATCAHTHTGLLTSCTLYNGEGNVGAGTFT